MGVVNFPPRQDRAVMSEVLVLGVQMRTGTIVLMRPCTQITDRTEGRLN